MPFKAYYGFQFVDVGLVGYQTSGSSDFWTSDLLHIGLVGCRTYVTLVEVLFIKYLLQELGFGKPDSAKWEMY